MKVTLTLGDGTRRKVSTIDGANLALVDGDCPECSKPLRIVGSEKHIESHDTYAAKARCVECEASVGVVRAVVETLFGPEEDEAVLVHGRPRVYGRSRTRV